MIDAPIEPVQPRRFEKNANMLRLAGRDDSPTDKRATLDGPLSFSD
jgi:hypothetical protein